jgi:hypothetical protein
MHRLVLMVLLLTVLNQGDNIGTLITARRRLSWRGPRGTCTHLLPCDGAAAKTPPHANRTTSAPILAFHGHICEAAMVHNPEGQGLTAQT